MGNYRLISLLPIPGKILEKIIHQVISNHLEANDLLTKFQVGFRKGYSTTSSIVSLTNDIFKGFNNHNGQSGSKIFSGFVKGVRN